MKKILVVSIAAVLLTGCLEQSQESKDKKNVQQQQSQYAIGQPIPKFDFSIERDLIIKLYKLRNKKVATHSVWRADFGMVEGDCPSFGYGIPFDTSLTNPLQRIAGQRGAVAIEQAEPNGIFASKNTTATWVMCLGDVGLEPVYVESKVSVYPGPVKVDYDTNRVTRSGAATVMIKK